MTQELQESNRPPDSREHSHERGSPLRPVMSCSSGHENAVVAALLAIPARNSFSVYDREVITSVQSRIGSASLMLLVVDIATREISREPGNDLPGSGIRKP